MSTRLRRRSPVTRKLNLYIHSDDQELWAAARIEAGKLGVSLSSLVAESVAQYLDRAVLEARQTAAELNGHE